MSISVIIPTLNEANTIAGLLSFIKTHGQDVAEVIVVDGGSSDGTVNLASAAGAVVLSSKFPSRAIQMNMGGKIASGDILYFVHADVTLPKTFCEDIGEAVESGYPAGCYRFTFDSPHPLLKINAFFTRFRGIMCRGGDQTLFITRQLFSLLKGFDEFYSIMEDYDLIRRIQDRSAFRVIPRDVIVSCRKYKANSWLRVQLANMSVFVMYLLRFHPDKIKSFYKKALH
jgi:rSAM/selenodomain-associated transferase 2